MLFASIEMGGNGVHCLLMVGSRQTHFRLASSPRRGVNFAVIAFGGFRFVGLDNWAERFRLSVANHRVASV